MGVLEAGFGYVRVRPDRITGVGSDMKVGNCGSWVR
jgi:hypothetical protein